MREVTANQSKELKFMTEQMQRKDSTIVELSAILRVLQALPVPVAQNDEDHH